MEFKANESMAGSRAAASDMIDVEARVIDEATAKKHLEAGYAQAEKLLKDPDKLEETLLRLEKKLKDIPAFGDALSDVPLLIMLVRDFVRKEYTLIPIGSIVAALSAILYVAAPLDVLPDFIPVLGVVDDVAVVALCMTFISSDVDDYMAWRESTGRAV